MLHSLAALPMMVKRHASGKAQIAQQAEPSAPRSTATREAAGEINLSRQHGYLGDLMDACSQPIALCREAQSLLLGDKAVCPDARHSAGNTLPGETLL